jgi:hypothetical protein
MVGAVSGSRRKYGDAVRPGRYSSQINSNKSIFSSKLAGKERQVSQGNDMVPLGALALG